MSLPSHAQLDALRMQTDPVADAIVTRLIEEEGIQEAKKLFDVLVRNIDIPFTKVPDYVREYMEDNSGPWEGIDLERVKRGQKVFEDYGSTFLLVLFFKSLPTCYLNVPGAPVLTQTGRLDKDRKFPETYARRIGETMQFLLDTMALGNLEPGQKGVNTVLKVRLIHATIRAFIQQGATPGSDRKPWNIDEWQMPINQEDLVFTLFSFSIIMVQAMRQLETPMSRQEEEDYYYAWVLVGHYLGIQPDLIPETASEAEQLLELILERHAGAGEDGQQLTAALIAFAEELLWGKVLDATPTIFLQFFMGEKYATMLGVSGKAGCLGGLLPQFLSRWLKASEKLEDKSEPVGVLINQAGMALVRGIMNYMNRYKGGKMRIPEKMKQAWGVEE